MEQIFEKYICCFFEKLMKVYSFKIKSEINEGQTYMIEYSSTDFVIKIEKYFREFYVTMYKVNDESNEINLFNLLEFVKQNDLNTPKSKYFRTEKNLEVCYKEQLKYLSTVIYDHYAIIIDFFCNDNYESRLAEFDKYWQDKHPELYRTI
jgi:hypothetical protein